MMKRYDEIELKSSSFQGTVNGPTLFRLLLLCMKRIMFDIISTSKGEGEDGNAPYKARIPAKIPHEDLWAPVYPCSQIFR
jgi:hypothetical protein